VTTAETSWGTILSLNGQGFINREALKAYVHALVEQRYIPLSIDIFCFESILRALYDGFSLEGIAQTAAAQLATAIIYETLILANGNKTLAARLLQIDEAMLESRLSPVLLRTFYN
jgi:hypothetical protein